MSQPRHHSLLEVLLNIGSGFVLALGIQFTIAWAYDLPLKAHDNVMITSIFTVVSIVRSYAWRRYFNWRQHGKT